jgi:hypothetical protein
LIHSKLLLEQQKNEQIAKMTLAISEKQKKKLFNEKRKKELEAEIEELRATKQRFNVIFLANGKDENTFEQSTQFKALLDNLDTKKDLERGLYENEMKIRDLESKLSVLAEEKKVGRKITLRHWNWPQNRKARPRNRIPMKTRKMRRRTVHW